MLKFYILILLIILTGCRKDELAEPKEYHSYSVNLNSGQAPQGFMNWSWGISPDSSTWKYKHKTLSLAKYRIKHPDWVTHRKSGIDRYSLNLLPDDFRTEYGLTFNSVHLLFHPDKGLAAWERVIDSRAILSDRMDIERCYSIILDSLTCQFGSPHDLQPKDYEDRVQRKQAALWKSDEVSMTLIVYSYPNKQKRIYQVVSKHF